MAPDKRRISKTGSRKGVQVQNGKYHGIPAAGAILNLYKKQKIMV